MAAVKVQVEPRLAMDVPVTQLPPGDPRLVEAIVSQLKSKGIFDQFRKECLADVDTKPAFQNLRQRVEGHVNKFLEKRTWKSDINKNQLRDGVRKHVNSLGILDSGIDAIITQVVNPKIKPLILPYVEDTVYAFLQIDKPKRERQDPNTNVPSESVAPQVIPAPEVKPSLLPMETDVISSEEDDILARESPESEHKSPLSSNEDFMEPENEDAQDGFESFPSADDNNTDAAVASHVEKLSLADNTEESKPLPTAKQPLPLFDDQSLDSISSNSSGLTFSTLSGKGSPGSRKSSDKDDSIKQEPRSATSTPLEPRSATSTPLVDEKPMDDISQPSSVASEPPKDYPDTASETKTNEPCSPTLKTVPTSATPHYTPGTEKDDQTVLSGASFISQDSDSQESRASTSKVSLSSFKSEVEEKKRSDKSEGELSTSSSELSDSDKGKAEHSVDDGKHHSSDSSHKSSKSRSDHKSKDREREKDRHSKHSKDKDKKHSKSRDDHHSHRDKDKKHHRRDKDHDGDRDRSRSHHHQSSSSSTSKESSSSGKGSGEKEKEHSSHTSGDKSAEGKSRHESSVEKDTKSARQTEDKLEGSCGVNKSVKPTESKSDGSGTESNKESSTNDKSSGKHDSKLEKKNEKSETKSNNTNNNNKGERNFKHSVKQESKTDKLDNKSSSKSENKSGKTTSEKTEKKHSVYSSKSSSKHSKHDGDKIHSDKYKSINIFKEDKKKRDEKNMKKDKEGLESKHTKEEKELKHEKEKEGREKKHTKEGKDLKRGKEENHHREEKDQKRSKDEKDSKDDKEEKIKINGKEVNLKLKELRIKLIRPKENRDKIKGVHECDKKVKSHKETISKKHLSSPKDAETKNDRLLLFNDEQNVMVVSYDDDTNSCDSDTPLAKTEKQDKHLNGGQEGIITNTKKMEKSSENKTQKQIEAKDTVPDFEGFSNTERDTRLADFLATTRRVPDEMDIEYSDWFDENDLHMVVSEDDIKEKMDFGEFLSCMNKLGAIVQASSIDMDLEESDSKKTQNVPEKNAPRQLRGKRRRISTSSSASSSTSLSGSPSHKRTRSSCMIKSDASQLVEQDSVIVSGFTMLTPEDDGNRTSSRDYEVDYSQRITTYSPLSPASDSSADDGKVKSADPSTISGRRSSSRNNNKRAKAADMFKPVNTWTNERNLSV